MNCADTARSCNILIQGGSSLVNPRGPQQAEILDVDAEIRAEILLEIRDPKSQAIFFPIISV